MPYLLTSVAITVIVMIYVFQVYHFHFMYYISTFYMIILFIVCTFLYLIYLVCQCFSLFVIRVLDKNEFLFFEVIKIKCLCLPTMCVCRSPFRLGYI